MRRLFIIALLSVIMISRLTTIAHCDGFVPKTKSGEQAIGVKKVNLVSVDEAHRTLKIILDYGSKAQTIRQIDLADTLAYRVQVVNHEPKPVKIGFDFQDIKQNLKRGFWLVAKKSSGTGPLKAIAVYFDSSE